MPVVSGISVMFRKEDSPCASTDSRGSTKDALIAPLPQLSEIAIMTSPQKHLYRALENTKNTNLTAALMIPRIVKIFTPFSVQPSESVSRPITKPQNGDAIIAKT